MPERYGKGNRAVRRFALGVLWHPEEGDDDALFTELVAEARRYRGKGE